MNYIMIINFISYIIIVISCLVFISKSKNSKLFFIISLFPFFNIILLVILILSDWPVLKQLNNANNEELLINQDDKVIKVDDGVICKNCNTYNENESIICIKCFKTLI